MTGPTQYGYQIAGGGTGGVTSGDLTTGLATKPNLWTVTAVKTGTYTAAPWELVRCDATSGSFTVTLPAASTAGQQVAVKLLATTGGNTVTVQRAGTDTINNAGTTITVTLTDEAAVLTANGTGIWTVAEGRLTLTSLDARYPLTGDARFTSPYAGDGTTLKLRPEGVADDDGELRITNGAAGTALTFTSVDGNLADVNLYRSGVDTLKTDDALIVASPGDATNNNMVVVCSSSNGGLRIDNSAATKKWRINAGSSTTSLFFTEVGGADFLVVHGQSLVQGNALATSATAGFFYLAATAGVPAGTAAAESGHVALTYDTTTDRFKVHSGSWKTYAPILDGSATLDFGSITAGSALELTITVTGAAAGDTVMLGPPAALEAGLVATGYVSATNTVTIRLHNFTGSALDPASATWKVRVGK